MPIEATEETFERDVIQASYEHPVVVDFWAEWCGPCRSLGPVIEKAVDNRDGQVSLVKVDTDANQRLAQAFGIQSIPAVKAFKDGKVVDEFIGALPPAQVERFLDRIVPSEADALVAEGGESNLRRALELEPGRADAAVPLRAPARRRRRSRGRAGGAGQRRGVLRRRRSGHAAAPRATTRSSRRPSRPWTRATPRRAWTS